MINIRMYKDILEGNKTAISHAEARDIVNKYFAELEEKMNAASIEQGVQFLEENSRMQKAKEYCAETFNVILSALLGAIIS